MDGYKLGYDEQYRGAKWVAQQQQSSYAPEIRTLGLGSGVNRECKPGEYFTTTGYYFYYPGQESTKYYQTISGTWYIPYGEYCSTDWKIVDHAVTLPKYSRDDAQRYVDEIIKNNIHITENNLLCARYAEKFTADQRKQIAQLQKRVYDRMESIENAGYCTNVEKSYPKGYADLEPYLAALMKSEGIGLVWWAWCIIGAVVIGTLAGAAYFVYRDLFAESKDDVKWSDELTKVLEGKLTEEEYLQLQEETQGIVTRAKIRAKLGTWGSAIKVVGLVVGGMFLYKFISDRSNKKQQ